MAILGEWDFQLRLSLGFAQGSLYCIIYVTTAAVYVVKHVCFCVCVHSVICKKYEHANIYRPAFLSSHFYDITTIRKIICCWF